MSSVNSLWFVVSLQPGMPTEDRKKIKSMNMLKKVRGNPTDADINPQGGRMPYDLNESDSIMPMSVR